MYEVTDLVADGATVEFDPGTSLLVTGERNETHDILMDLLAGARSGTSIRITTNTNARKTVGGFETRGALSPERIGIVDCTAQDSTEADLPVPVRYLNSPGDLTGISLEFAKLIREFGAERSRIHIGFSTISTVLMYADTETVFRFLHVFTSRIRTGDWFGVFALDPEMHEDQTVNTVRAVFDCEAVVENGDVDLRGDGFRERD